MIKKLKGKFLICLFLLVAIFTVTSSCYAVSYNFNSVLFYDGYNYLLKNGYSVSLSKDWILSYSSDGSYTLVFFNSTVGNVTIMSNKHCYYFNSTGSAYVYPSRTILKYVDGSYTVTNGSSSADMDIVSSNIISSLNIYNYSDSNRLGSLLCNAYDLPESSDNNVSGDGTSSYPFTIEDIYSSSAFINANETLGRGFNSSNSNVLVFTDSDLGDDFYHIVVLSNEIAYVRVNENNTYFRYYDKNDNVITNNKLTIIGSYSSSGLVFYTDEASYQMYGAGIRGSASGVKDITTLKVLNSDGSVFFNPGSNTSFKYSFEGVKRGQVKLSIDSLDSSLRMYGYVGLNTTFTIGDTLDTSANINSLRLMASRSDNSDLYCYLYEGEEVNYYIVDENNVILDIGYISEMAKGYFLYGFEVNNGVDFVFLKDGQVYWSNNLSFKYSLNNNVIEDNNIVSAGSSTYIISDKTVSNGKYVAYVYDINNNLLSKASCKYSNNLSSLSINVTTSYEEDNDFFNEGIWYINFIDLEGTNSDGSLIDFSDYYIRWSVPTNIEIIEIRYNNGTYDKRNGIFDSPSSIGHFACFWSIRDYISEYKSDKYVSFDITLQVYDGNDNLVLTHVINSDDIVEDKIVSEENNVDKGDYGILDNPGYTGGSNNSSNIGNIQNWTADDYINLMSTDNFVWEFFKAILGNLPWWITTPLTILIFGVVIITIIRFARGA